MRLVIQRVNSASVTIAGVVHSSIQKGLMVLIGIENADTEEDAEWLAGKLIGLRIFDDEVGVMNRSVTDIDGEVLVVSQFTLHALTKKGNRPSYIRAAGHEKAVPLYTLFCKLVSDKLGKEVKTGIFAADMQVALVNNGPVTILIDSQNKE
ncbi:MAG: D-tyrosyl-tRNA(Tyr) deacylase [Paludibacter sp.]|nr:D-tyrosyl-tRNA(Tyr) deacylase [Paludibacter sp.]